DTNQNQHDQSKDAAHHGLLGRTIAFQQWCILWCPGKPTQSGHGHVSLRTSLPVEARDLKIGVSLETNSIDPLFSTTSPNAMLARPFFDELVLTAEQHRLQPGLALSWQPIGETAWEFHLRPGVKFHDGSAFTAED